MNDDEVAVIVRDSLADTRMSVPVGDILRRGEKVRARRRRARGGALIGLATLAAVAAGLALGNTSTSHVGRSKTTRISLAGYTVTRQSADSISVTVRQLVDLSGLQAELRSDGVPAIVGDTLNAPSGCSQWNGGNYSEGQFVTLANRTGLPDSNGVEFTIHPSEVPTGVVAYFGLLPVGAPAGSPGPPGPMTVQLLSESSTCAAG